MPRNPRLRWYRQLAHAEQTAEQSRERLDQSRERNRQPSPADYLEARAAQNHFAQGLALAFMGAPVEPAPRRSRWWR